MGQEAVSKGVSTCSHGGVYSVNPQLVRVDCSSSINPLGTPRKAIAAIQKSAKSLAPMYPDPECRELKKSLSRYLCVDPEWISVGNGAVEIIYWFAHAFAKGRVVIPAPTFCEYELASRKAGAGITFVPLHDFELDADEIIEKTKGTDGVFLCNPNNPTGMLATQEIKKIIESVDSSTKILLDECFVELVDDPGANSMISMTEDFDNLVILRSLTKSFGLAGLRVGYSVCNPSLADKFSANKIPWNVNGLAQAAGVAALADKKHLSRARAIVKKERRFLHDRIAKLKSFKPLRSDANYFLVVLQGRNSTQFRDALLKKTGVLVRDCSTFTGMGSRHIRVAVKSHKENLRLLKALEGFDG
ncbi:MAG TPA: histidinol-phosphate transaminase [Nitrososphaera sp.]|nr:histidinol-phosphate transaminase [Nitrososphaera sp.]